MKSIKALTLAAVLIALPSQAALISSSAELTITDSINFNQVLSGSSPTTLTTTGGRSVTLAGNYEPSPAFWDLGANGFWSLGKTFVALDDGLGALSFTLSQAVSGIGAFFNHDPAFGPVTIAAFSGDSVNPLETYSFSLDTPNGQNAGAFRGIQRSDDDITRFTVSNAYVAVDDLVLSVVPEPSSYALLAAGIVAFGFVRRRRKR